MTYRRKTINVTDLIDTANRMLAASVPEFDRERRAIGSLVEWLLMDANAYRGYGYLASEFLPADEQTDAAVLRPDYDETRRRYFHPSN